MTNKKKLFIGIAVILVVVIILLIMFLPKDKPEKTTIDLTYLLDVNREHFEKLESMSSEVHLHFDSCVEEEYGPNYQYLDLTANTEIDFKTNNKHTIATYLENQSNENLDKFTTTTHELYIVPSDDDEMVYAKENNDGGWYTSVDLPQLKQIAESKDFGYIVGYERVLTLDENIVEIDGVRCYKASGRIFNIQKILNHYNLNDLQNVTNMFFDGYADVELYFREDNHLLHSFVYDLSDYWQNEFGLISENEGKSATCNYTLTIKYNSFNNSANIVVPDVVLEESVEELKDPFEHPINIDNRYYNITLGDIVWKLGSPISEYVELANILPLFEDDHIREHGEVVLPNQEVALLVNDGIHDSFIIWVQNINTESVPYMECRISGIDLGEMESIIKDFNIENKVTHKTTLAEVCKVFGRYNLMTRLENAKDIYWRSAIDGVDIHLIFSNETKQIVQVQVSAFNIYHFLGIEDPRPNEERNPYYRDDSGTVEAETVPEVIE